MHGGEGFFRALGLGEVVLCMWCGDYRQVAAKGGFHFLIKVIPAGFGFSAIYNGQLKLGSSASLERSFLTERTENTSRMNATGLRKSERQREGGREGGRGR